MIIINNEVLKMNQKNEEVARISKEIADLEESQEFLWVSFLIDEIEKINQNTLFRDCEDGIAVELNQDRKKLYELLKSEKAVYLLGAKSVIGEEKFICLMNKRANFISRLRKIIREALHAQKHFSSIVEQIKREECGQIFWIGADFPHLERELRKLAVSHIDRAIGVDFVPVRLREKWIEIQDDKVAFLACLRDTEAIILRLSQMLVKLEETTRKIDKLAGKIEEKHLYEYISPSRVRYLRDEFEKVCKDEIMRKIIEERLHEIKLHPEEVDWISEVRKDQVISHALQPR